MHNYSHKVNAFEKMIADAKEMARGRKALKSVNENKEKSRLGRLKD